MPDQCQRPTLSTLDVLTARRLTVMNLHAGRVPNLESSRVRLSDGGGGPPVTFHVGDVSGRILSKLDLN